MGVVWKLEAFVRVRAIEGTDCWIAGLLELKNEECNAANL